MIKLGRLETSEDFKVSKKEKSPSIFKIEKLKISVRKLTKKDIKDRKLPNQTSGLVIVSIENDSPMINSVEVDSIIIEVQKKKIKSSEDLKKIIENELKSDQKTLLFAIYNTQNQRRYIGVKLD